MSNAEIAGRLYVAVSTVKTHLVHIYAKLGIGNRVALTNLVSAFDHTEGIFGTSAG